MWSNLCVRIWTDFGWPPCVDNALSRAPNAGAAKNVINLNGFWALVLSTLFMNGRFTPKLGLGSALVLLGAYLSTD